MQAVVQLLVLLVLPSASLLGLIVGQWEGLMMGEEVVMSPPLLWSCLHYLSAGFPILSLCSPFG